MAKHGRESWVDDSGTYVIKKPLPRTSATNRVAWAKRQLRGAETTDKLIARANDAYCVPKTTVDDTNCIVFEDKMSGAPLSVPMFKHLDSKQQEYIIDAFAQFYADIHSIDMIAKPVPYKIAYTIEEDEDFLIDFLRKEMKKWFPQSEIKFVRKSYEHLGQIEYESRMVWGHHDLFEGNVLFDAKRNKLSFIDFTEAGYNFLHYDMAEIYLYKLGIVDALYKRYLKYRNNNDLPADFMDTEKWNAFVHHQKIARVFQDLSKKADELEFYKYECSVAAQNKTIARIREQVASLHKLSACER